MQDIADYFWRCGMEYNVCDIMEFLQVMYIVHYRTTREPRGDTNDSIQLCNDEGMPHSGCIALLHRFRDAAVASGAVTKERGKLRDFHLKPEGSDLFPHCHRCRGTNHHRGLDLDELPVWYAQNHRMRTVPHHDGDMGCRLIALD
jgi:hypothetical protein